MSCLRKGNNINFCGGASSEVKVILYHADWCGHCKTFIDSGDWQKIQNMASSLPIKFEKYEENTEQAQEADGKGLVKGWPTIIIVKDGNTTMYNGRRNPSEMLNYLKNLVGGSNGGSVETLQNKYNKMPDQCGGAKKNNSKNEDYYKKKYLKYKAKYMLEKSRI